jgi:hypothetical protein
VSRWLGSISELTPGRLNDSTGQSSAESAVNFRRHSGEREARGLKDVDVDEVEDLLCNLFGRYDTRVAVMCDSPEKSGGRERLDSAQREDERSYHLDADLDSIGGRSGRPVP